MTSSCKILHEHGQADVVFVCGRSRVRRSGNDRCLSSGLAEVDLSRSPALCPLSSSQWSWCKWDGHFPSPHYLLHGHLTPVESAVRRASNSTSCASCCRIITTCHPNIPASISSPCLVPSPQYSHVPWRTGLSQQWFEVHSALSGTYRSQSMVEKAVLSCLGFLRTVSVSRIMSLDDSEKVHCTVLDGNGDNNRLTVGSTMNGCEKEKTATLWD